MDVTRLLWLSGLIAGTTYIISTYNTSFTFQRPIETSVLTLLTTGVFILLSCRVTSLNVDELTASHPQSYALTPHIDKTKTHASRRRNASFNLGNARPLGTRRVRAIAVAIVVAVCLRVEILRRVINNSQCSKQSPEFWTPVGAAIYEILTSLAASNNAETHKTITWWKARLLSTIQSQTVLSSILLSVSSLLAASAYAMPHSSYICAHIGASRLVIPWLQDIGATLDTVLLVLIDVLLSRTSKEPAMVKSIGLLGWLSIASSILLFVLGLIPWITLQYRWYLEDFSGIYLTHTLYFAITTSFTALCGLRVFCWLGPSRASTSTTFIVVYISSLISALEHRRISSPVSGYANLFYLGLASIGLALSFLSFIPFPNVTQLGGSKKNVAVTKFGNVHLLSLILFTALPVGFWLIEVPQVIQGHPIDTLISTANVKHQAWALQASLSTSLNEAARNYRQRYGRDPPPNFDHWYQYAELHNSLVIDDFDNIYNDILPFWSLPPVQLRQRTLEAIANPWNDIAGIMIRSGTVETTQGTPGTHDWMMHGIADMIRPFAQWLPDMDLAFNLNDEGRVAIPYEAFEPLLETAIEAFEASTGTDATFSPFHLRNWPPIPETPISNTRFFERSWHPTWEEFGAITCPPTSPARTHHAWDFSHTTPSYLTPHTFHTYISDYSASFSTCHQPDLAHLHGLHMSPAAFKGTYDLVPVFSQSKAGGYSDIRYPSAWNYFDRERTMYAPNDTYPDPPFTEKERTLFWRGGTTEGVSAFETGSWQGMARQRMVWMFENARDADGVGHVVYLPTKSTTTQQQQQRTYTPHLIPPSHLPSHLPTNISLHIPTLISRCADSSCHTQHLEFTPDAYRPVDFQEHWRHKYLLDMDGAGFSGRFLPFLQSGSVVLKMGVVREWWEGRVWPWRDFVPLDVRGGEVVGVLAFLGGWWGGEAEVNGDDDMLMRPRDDLAEAIAMQGQRTANTMLRKVDMEIYMFRLLLEWGRVVDENRALLGWRGDL